MKNADEKAKLIEEVDENKDKRLCSTCCQFPKAVYFILSNEFCERFNFYGFKTVLLLYFTNHIMIDQHQATAYLHAFISLAYFTPLFGGILADTFIGKYWTILILSIVYVIGCSILTFTAMAPPNLAGPLVGLLLTAIGTGGIKPCVSTFGADQFPEGNKRMIDSYFAVFYWAINLGSLSSFFTPMLRGGVRCFNDDCYALAFGVPLMLMAVAVVVFILGTTMYVRKPVNENVLCKMIRCVFGAIRNWSKERKTNPRPQFLEYSGDQYSMEFLEDVRCVGRVLLILLTFPMFYALYDQMSSRWVLQASDMDGHLFGTTIILPEQMTTLNTVFVLLFVPLCDSVLYPLLEMAKLKYTYLRRIGTGFFLVGLSFFVAFLLQISLETRAPVSLLSTDVRMRLLPLEPCQMNATLLGTNSTAKWRGLPQGLALTKTKDLHFSKELKSIPNLKFAIKMAACASINVSQPVETTFEAQVEAGQSYTLAAYWDSGDTQLKVALLNNTLKARKVGKGEIRVLSRNDALLKAGSLVMKSLSTASTSNEIDLSKSVSPTPDLLVTPYESVGRSFFETSLRLSNPSKLIHLGTQEVGMNEVGTFLLRHEIVAGPGTNLSTSTGVAVVTWHVTHLVERVPSKVSILWQTPQYAIITMAEVLFAVSSYGFIYMESPDSVRSIMTSFLLVSIGIGNLVIVLAAEVQIFPKLSYQFLFFMGLCWLTMVLYIVLAMLFKSRVPTEIIPVEEPLEMIEDPYVPSNVTDTNEEDKKQ